ncbi:MAG: transcription termination/antitermination protein NusA [Ignavibacteriales bacterium]|nr:transcription termination/antitermination protein NusA [Ignavibacteriales bacterium]
MNHEIVESFAQMVREKGIDKDILVGIVEDIFGMMVRKKYGPTAKFEVVVNMDKGDIEIYLEREVVEEVADPVTQISLKEASQKSGEALDVGEDYVEIVPLVSFGRRLVVSAKQNLNQRIKEIEREAIYNEYSGALGEIVVGEIYQIRKGKGEILVIHNKNELILPRNEQIYKERYKKGDTIRAVVKEVRKGAGNPVVIISRTDPHFLMRLFEIEIPEIYDGIIEIKAIAREPGDRAKVAVLSHDDRIDAVGACVGMKGVRIHAIVRELNNENIDVINWTDESMHFITRSLSPAKLKEVVLDKENKKASVTVAADQVSLAIGKNGQNVRLASKLTGYDIQLVKEGGEDEEYDMDLSEFREELGDVLFHKFFDEKYESVRDVIDTPKEELVATLGVEREKIDEIVTMLRRGLEEAEIEEGGEPEGDAPAEKPAAQPEEQASVPPAEEAPAGESAVSDQNEATTAPDDEKKE